RPWLGRLRGGGHGGRPPGGGPLPGLHVDEMRDLLAAAALEHLELLGPEIDDGPPALVGPDGVELDDLGRDADGGNASGGGGGRGGRRRYGSRRIGDIRIGDRRIGRRLRHRRGFRGRRRVGNARFRGGGRLRLRGDRLDAPSGCRRRAHGGHGGRRGRRDRRR